MIEKTDFYHGAALIRVIEDARCRTIQKTDHGYVVNQSTLIYPKYTTKTHSPWHFTLSTDDVSRLRDALPLFSRAVITFICGGDGICGVPLGELRSVTGSEPSWITLTRKFNGSYAVSGRVGALSHKIARNRWPAVIFEDESHE
ncbi:MAG: hypothetical protein LAN70_08490 [Acidobacteriia bacterium]|jgi:hypothetical protein|nr:hypothetical protein [Terriglobia bacterium]